MNDQKNTPTSTGNTPNDSADKTGNSTDISNTAVDIETKAATIPSVSNKENTASVTVGGVQTISPSQSPDGDGSAILKTGQVTEVELIESEKENVTELPLPPLPKAGYRISKFILFIISGYLLFLAIFLSFKSFDASDKIVIPAQEISDSSFAHQKELIQALQQEKKDYREFIMQISQMVLLNLLLPTLTAVLGYIFGSREEAQTRKSS